jgi:hypothetical protein
MIADAWDKVIRAHDEDMLRATHETLLTVAAQWDRLAEHAREASAAVSHQ